jgi:predicted transcriptional regulator
MDTPGWNAGPADPLTPLLFRPQTVRPKIRASKAESLLLLESRRRIYDYIKVVPGIHLRALQRELSMPLGTLEYHLYQMEREGLLVTREDGRFKGYFPADELDRRDRDYLYYLRQEMPRRISVEVAHEPGVSFQHLAQRLPISPSTLSFHLKKLLKAGMLAEQQVGREKTYTCAEAERVQKLVVRYRKTFVDEVVDRFAEAWLSLGLE